MVISMENGTADIIAPGNPTAHPNSFVYPTKDGIEKTTYSNNTIGYSVLLFPNGANWNYIMTVPSLEDSIFSKLFFLEGHRSKYFEKFSDTTSVTGNRIITWKVDWTGKQKTLLPQFIEKEEDTNSTQ